MNTKALVFSVIAACLSSSSFAQSYEYRDDNRRDRYERQYGSDYDGHDRQDDREYRRDRVDLYERSDYDRRDHRDRYREGRRQREGAGPYGDLYVGMRLPQAYWNGSHRVRDWRRARLSPPLPGCNWHRIGNDFVMSSVSTGKITRIIVN